MPIIYIRHGKDQKGRHEHDEKLTKEGKKEILKFTEEMIEKYGIPDIIYYSPFHRTSHTAKYMLKKIKKIKDKQGINKKVSLKVEPRLGRFFTGKERKNPDIRESTQYKGAIINEEWEEFQERVNKHFKSFEKSKYNNIWNITHSLVILQVARLKNIERNPRVEYLDTLVLL